LTAAAAAGPVLPVVISTGGRGLRGRAKWRWGEAVRVFASTLAAAGMPLILRQGDPAAVLEGLAAEVGARSVHWTRCYDPASIARDTAVKARLTEAGLSPQSHPGHLIHEPWSVETGQGGFFKVYTPFWRRVSGAVVAEPLPVPL
jgi:deoxyribodipyrimidine photo-lyase